MIEESAEHFDVDAWNALLRSDPEVSEAAARLRAFGERYVDDFAASYLAIGDKTYLQRIVSQLLHQAENDGPPAQASGKRAPPGPDRPAESRTRSSDDAGAARRKRDPLQFGQDGPTPRQYAQTDRSERPATGGVDERTYQSSSLRGKANGLTPAGMIGWAAVVLLILAAVVAGAHVQHESERSQFEGADEDMAAFQRARGNIDALNGYLNNCHRCVARGQANDEIRQLEDTEKKRLTDERAQPLPDAEARLTEQRAYYQAGTNVELLKQYVESCHICVFKVSAEREIYDLTKGEIGANSPPPPQNTPAATGQPTHQVTWRMVNNTGLGVSIAFYSQTRARTGWPGWDRNWPMALPSTLYTLECQPGEKICFGAWETANPGGPRIWGVGAFSAHPCANCCIVCNGGSYMNTLVLGQ